MNKGPEALYTQRRDQFQAESVRLQNRLRWLGFSRLVVFLAIVGWLWWMWNATAVALTGAGLLSALFLWLLRYFERTKSQRNFKRALVKVNKNELKGLNGDFEPFPSGDEFRDASHPYTSDLDFFGRKGLFPRLNRSPRRDGQQRLAEYLKDPLLEAAEIKNRQEALKQLAEKTGFRQTLQVHAGNMETQREHFSFLKDWIGLEGPKLPFSTIRVLLWTVPVLSVLITVLYAADVVTGFQFALYLMFPLGVLGFYIKQINTQYAVLSKVVEGLTAFEKGLGKIEEESFDAPLLKALQQKLKHEQVASREIEQLKKIAQAFDQRNNLFVGIVLNIYLLWDLRMALRVERWKESHSVQIDAWFDVFNEFEALNSLANYVRNHPGYCIPETADEKIIDAKNLGHPLIAENELVTNDVNIRLQEHFVILTGANMAGKSTFLRTLGVNLVLAMTGCAVNAVSFRFYPMKLYTGMRTDDSLSEHTSYFFAELKRLNRIIDILKQGTPLFVVLDEVLKGTNSKDKEEGSKKLVARLLDLGAGGVIATHDLGLCDLEEQLKGRVTNMAFETTIKDDDLHFDYKLKPGVCQTMNASFLMEKMGITGGES